MTAHLITTASNPDDAFYRSAAKMLHHRFEITNAMLQAVREPFMLLCGEPETL